MLHGRLADSPGLPAPFRNALGSTLDRAVTLAERVAGADQEVLARQAATALYDAASAVLLAWEGAQRHADARPMLLARFVLAHKLTPVDPLAPEAASWEQPAIDAILGTASLTPAAAAPLLSL
jgi:hypothetical protein